MKALLIGFVLVLAGCSFDPGGLVATDLCGNGTLDPGEACDGDLLAGRTCESLGQPSGVLTCTASCTLDPSQCTGDAACGDGVVDPGETCDGTNLGGETCSTQGFSSGQLACDTDCLGYDTTTCDSAQCGNGVLEPGEACDDGFTDDCGSCNADCSGPGTAATCGDGIRCPETEACDDGFTDDCGSCNADCSGPGMAATCGDGIRCPETEACDDGYTDDCGSCNADCSGPGTGSCGDGQWCPETEGCDDGNADPSDGCSAACEVVPPYSCVNTPGATSVCSAGTCPGVPITPGTYAETTSDGFTDIDDYVGWQALGKGMAFTIQVPAGDFVKVRVTTTAFDAVLLIMDGCPGTTILAGSDWYGSSGTESAFWVNSAGSGPVTVTIMVDGYDTIDEGDYDLEVILGQALTPGSAAALSFNEYFAFPTTGVDARREWVEFYHAGVNHFNLRGCRFVTDSLDANIDEDIIVSPGEYFVFDNAEESSLGMADHVVFGWTSSAGVIHGTNDTLYLYSPGGGVIDRIGRLTDNNFPNVQGSSIALSPAYLGNKTANDDGTNWAADSTPTPGFPNN